MLRFPADCRFMRCDILCVTLKKVYLCTIQSASDTVRRWHDITWKIFYN